MLLDTLDMLILSLVANCRYLKVETVRRFGFAQELEAGIDVLLKQGLLATFGRKREYLRFGAKAAGFMRRHGNEMLVGRYYAHADPKPARLARYAEITMTCLRAGIDSASNSIDAMTNPPAFITSVPLRDGKEKHLVSTAQCAGFGYWQDSLYQFYHLSNSKGNLMFQYEAGLLHSIAPLFGAPFDTPGAFVLAGDSYESVYEVLRQPQEQRPNRAVTYSKAFADTTVPTLLLSCDETGAMQLAITRQQNYKPRLLNAVVGAGVWKPPDKKLDADAIVDGIPLILAVDMNIKRVFETIKMAKAQGQEKVYVVALQEQAKRFWQRQLPTQGIDLFAFPFETVSGEFGEPLYSPPRGLATAPGGGLLFV